MSTNGSTQPAKKQTPRERFWEIWSKIVGILIVPPFLLLLYATSNPWDSFFERLVNSVPLAIGFCLAGFILMILGFPFSRLFSAEASHARLDSGGETLAKEALDFVGKAFAQEAQDAGAVDIPAGEVGDGEAESGRSEPGGPDRSHGIRSQQDPSAERGMR